MSELSQRNREQRELNQRLRYVRVFKDGFPERPGEVCEISISVKNVPYGHEAFINCKDALLLKIYNEIMEVFEYCQHNSTRWRVRCLSHDVKNVNFELYERNIHPKGCFLWNTNQEFNDRYLGMWNYTAYRTMRRRSLQRTGKLEKPLRSAGRIDDRPVYVVQTKYEPHVERIRRVIR